MIVLGRDLRVEMHGAVDIWRAVGIDVHVGEKIPDAIVTVIETLTTTWENTLDGCIPAVAMPWPDIVLRVHPLTGAHGIKVVVAVERFRARTNLAWARHAFSLSPREAEIIEFVLRGYATPLIASHMHIAESTAADHIKRLLDKTRSNNRAELVAKLLGWRSSEDEAPER
ncbi:MAG: helix-turn-helix transcriptional regulator [Candidatus Velthaea sp.]